MDHLCPEGWDRQDSGELPHFAEFVSPDGYELLAWATTDETVLLRLWPPGHVNCRYDELLAQSKTTPERAPNVASDMAGAGPILTGEWDPREADR